MAKQLRRIEKRYVPQQESYRQLPVPQPAARPVDITEEPVVDPTAEKLRSIAEGLGAFSKGLTDFLRMEKSFEETNRAEAVVRGRLGLPVGDGEGFLDYGVRRGYEQGRGITDAEQVAADYKLALADAKVDITPDKFKSADDVRAFSDKLLDDTLRKHGVDIKNSNKAYLESLGPELAKVKLEGRIESLSIYDAQVKLANVNAFNTKVDLTMQSDILPYLRGIAQDPMKAVDNKSYQYVRDKISQLSKMGSEVYRIDRDASNVFILETLMSNIQSQATLAFAEGSNWNAVADLEEMSVGLLKAIDLPDASGVRLTTTRGDAETTKAIGSLRSIVMNLSNASDQLREKFLKRSSDKLISDQAIKVFTGEQTIEQSMDNFKRLASEGQIDNEVALKAITGLHQVYESGAITQVSRETALKYMGLVLNGQLDPVEIMQLAQEESLPKDFMMSLLNARRAFESRVSWEQSQISYQRSLIAGDIEADARSQRATRTFNQNTFQSIIDKYKLTGDALEFAKYSVSSFVNDAYAKVDPVDLEDRIQDSQEYYFQITKEYAPREAALDKQDLLIPKDKFPEANAIIQLQKRINNANKRAKLFHTGTSVHREATLEAYALDEQLQWLTGKKTSKTTSGAPPGEGGVFPWQSK